MEINIKRNNLEQLVSLHAGDVFLYEERAYMVLCFKDHNNVVDLLTGKMLCINNSCWVEKCSATLNLRVGE